VGRSSTSSFNLHDVSDDIAILSGRKCRQASRMPPHAMLVMQAILLAVFAAIRSAYLGKAIGFPTASSQHLITLLHNDT